MLLSRVEPGYGRGMIYILFHVQYARSMGAIINFHIGRTPLEPDRDHPRGNNKLNIQRNDVDCQDILIQALKGIFVHHNSFATLNQAVLFPYCKLSTSGANFGIPTFPGRTIGEIVEEAVDHENSSRILHQAHYSATFANVSIQITRSVDLSSTCRSSRRLCLPLALYDSPHDQPLIGACLSV